MEKIEGGDWWGDKKVLGWMKSRGIVSLFFASLRGRGKYLAGCSRWLAVASVVSPQTQAGRPVLDPRATATISWSGVVWHWHRHSSSVPACVRLTLGAAAPAQYGVRQPQAQRQRRPSQSESKDRREKNKKAWGRGQDQEGPATPYVNSVLQR